MAAHPLADQPGRPYGLTKKQMDFCSAYMRLGKVAPAMIEAGYSKRSADKNGAALMRQPAVAAMLRHLVDKRFEEEAMSENEIIARTARIARFDPRQLANEDGTFKSLDQLDEATAAGIRGFETDLIIGNQAENQEGEGAVAIATRKYKFADPLPALRTLAQMKGMLSEGAQVMNVFVDMDSRLDAARRRKDADQAKRIDSKVVSEQ